MRVRVFASGLAAFTFMAAVPLYAQEPAGKPIRLVAAFSTGAFQILAHLMSEKLTAALGQPVVVEYRTGGGGNIATEFVAKAAPDGHTLVILNSTHAIAPILNSKLRYDVNRDFAPVSLLATVPNVLVVHPSLPVRTLRELAQFARANQGKLTYGSGGTGSFNHVGNELFRLLARADIMHVPYKGGSVALLNILSGEVDMVVVTVPATIPFIESKRLRALAVLSPERAPALPGVPTSAQAGMPELQFVTWYGLAGPAGMNPEFVARLNAETVRILNSPEEKQRLTKVGIDAATSTSVAFADYMRAEVAKWSRVIRETKIQINE